MMFVCIVEAKTTNIEHENDFPVPESKTNISTVQISTESELLSYISVHSNKYNIFINSIRRSESYVFS